MKAGGPQEFFRLRAEGFHCFSLSEAGLGPKPDPWETEAFKFEAFAATGGMKPQNLLVSREGGTGLDVVHTVCIHPQHDCRVMHLDVRQTFWLVQFEAVGPLGTLVARAELVGRCGSTQRVALHSPAARIHHVRVISPNGLCLIEGGGSATAAEETRDIAMDDLGNCYVTGFLHANAPSPWVGTGQRVLVSSYDGNGHLRWTRHPDGGSSSSQAGHSIAVDCARCVYVTGEFAPRLDFPNPSFAPSLPGIAVTSVPAPVGQTWTGRICPVCLCQDT